jgi:DNA-binding transcriptional MerR regulator
MPTYSVAELAGKAEVTLRTVRYYQATGLLQRPERSGRSVVYTDDHLQRLREIAELRSRGLKLASIRDLLHARSMGETPVVALLGPEVASDHWLAESSATMGAVEVAQLLGERYLWLLTDLETAGYLKKIDTPQGPRWRADDLPLLRGALQLTEIGTDVELSARARDLLRLRIRRMAEDLVAMWIRASGELYEGEATSEEFLLNLQLIRAVAWQSTAHIMAQEMQRALMRADSIRESVAPAETDDREPGGDTTVAAPTPSIGRPSAGKAPHP